MASRTLLKTFVVLAGLVLVAGCVQVDVPEGPYVVGSGGRDTSEKQPDAEEVEGMSREALEDQVLRLAAENDRLRQEIGGLKRKVKQLEKENDKLEDKIDDLED